MFRWLVALVSLIAVFVGGLFYLAAKSTPPTIAIEQPGATIGQKATLTILAGAPRAKFSMLTAKLEQNGQTFPLYSLDAPQSATVTPADADHVRISRDVGKASVPALKSGPARLIVEVERPSILNLRKLSASTSKDIQVRLEPPRVSVVSTHHYINHGGSELVLYRATPADVASGVRVGTIEYPGYDARGLSISTADPTLKGAFFSLQHDQELSAPIQVFARDDAGNEATASFIDNVFEKPFKKSRIEIDDKFLRRVVPEILDHSPELKLGPTAATGATSAGATDDLLPKFLKINGDLRKMNADKIMEVLASSTASSRLWKGPFVQLGNSKVEAGFADHRTYIYAGKEVDQQVHLGFDLAVTAGVAVVAANAGIVLNASWLGIYGNCVIIDHGMGVASLYGHLSSFDVATGAIVKKGQTIGRSGMTGLAGGDHLHFTMLVQGRPVNPVEWWDSHWIEDRVERKVREAGGNSAAAP